MSSRRMHPWLTEEGNGRPPAVSRQHAAARFWASHGMPVCRLIERDKRPTDKAPKTTGAGPEHRLASVDLDVIDRWWQDVHPYWGPRAQCNPGLPTGPWPGYLALDVDRPPIFEAWVGDRQLSATLRWSSCRPDHPERYTLLFSYPAVDFPIRSVLDGRPHCVPGVDLRADGEHVVLPGAVHAHGTVYSIQQDLLPAPLPRWLVAELGKRMLPARQVRIQPVRSGLSQDHAARAATAGAVAGLPSEALRQAYANALRLFERAARMANAARGQRHHTLVGLTWEGIARGLHPDDVRAAVLAYVDRACPERPDHAGALRQLEAALQHPEACQANEPRFSVGGQARWLLNHDPRWRGRARGSHPCRHPARRG